MAKNLSTKYLINTLLPDHVIASYPRLVDFLKVFLDYLNKENQSSYYQNTLYFQRDIREQDPEFFAYIKKELGALSSGKYDIDSKLLYDQVVKIWRSKGSEESLIFLLKAIYGADENTDIIYPVNYILRASDGIWEQERFITVRTVRGTIPKNASSIILVNNNVEQLIELTNLEIINSDITRFYFNINFFVKFEVDQTVKILDNDIVLFEGKVELSPVTLSVINGGKNWQVGQIIKIPGSVKDTVARVASATNEGVITSVEILEFGFEADPNKIFTVSPYSIKPVTADFDYSYDPNTATHDLTIRDTTDGFSENINGVTTNPESSDYFLDEYEFEDYSGKGVIRQTDIDLTSSQVIDSPSSVSLQEWLISRASLQYVFDTETKQKGSWTSNRGIISDSLIRLHDNFYYQKFSYDIISSKTKNEYQDLLDVVHVAGTKSFSTTNLQEQLDSRLSLIAEVPFKFIYLNEIINTFDNLDKSYTVKYQDTQIIEDINFDISFLIEHQDLVTVGDDDYKTVNVAPINDSVLSIDDGINISTDKLLESNAVATQFDELLLYNSENYFSEEYVLFATKSPSLEATLS